MQQIVGLVTMIVNVVNHKLTMNGLMIQHLMVIQIGVTMNQVGMVAVLFY